MSFDLYFVPKPEPGVGWDQVMDDLEAAAGDEKSPSSEDLALWDRIVEAIAPIVPEGEMLVQERSRQFDDGSGLQVNMFPGEISMSTPYWSAGKDAEHVVQRLQAVAKAIEEATGLVAYDPQADALFVDAGASAPAVFDQVHSSLEELMPGGDRGTSSQRPWWAFWRDSERRP